MALLNRAGIYEAGHTLVHLAIRLVYLFFFALETKAFFHALIKFYIVKKSGKGRLNWAQPHSF